MQYKILIVKNRYKKKLDWKKGIAHLEKVTPFKLLIEELNTDFDLKFKNVGNGSFAGVVPDFYYQSLQSVIPVNKYDAVVMVYGNNAPGVRVSITENTPLYPSTEMVVVVKETDSGKTFNHEIFHTFFKKLARKGIAINDPMDTYLNDNDLDAPYSNRTMALSLLSPHWSKITQSEPILSPTEPITMPTYKYFKLTESTGGGHTFSELHPDFRKFLDDCRGLAGIPFIINSGFRTKSENNALTDAVSDSSHLSGIAADIKCLDSTSRWKIITAAQKLGCKRIGIGKTYVHLDMDILKEQEVIWHYY